MFSRSKWFGIAAAGVVVLGLAACELTLSLAFAPTVKITSPASYSSVSTSPFTLSGTVSDNGKAVDGVYYKIGLSGTYAVIPGTENLATAKDTAWNINVDISGVTASSYFTVYVKGVSGDLTSTISRTFWKGSAFSETEPNDDYSTANTLTVNGADFTAQIQPSGDVDWFKVSLTGGVNYTIKTKSASTGSDADTKIFLYDTDHITQLAFNDDYSGTFSQVSFACPPAGTGTYYINVIGFNTVLEGTYAIVVTQP